MLIHGSEMVAVAQGLVEYRDSRWISGSTIRPQNSEHAIRRGMSRATRELLLGPSARARRNLRPSSVSLSQFSTHVNRHAPLYDLFVLYCAGERYLSVGLGEVRCSCVGQIQYRSRDRHNKHPNLYFHKCVSSITYLNL